VSDNGTVLLLDGGMKDGAMDLRGTAPDGVQQRIRWWPQPDGSVLQLWESSRDGGKTWECRFEGLYIPRRPAESVLAVQILPLDGNETGGWV
jgi:hypothetical protein